MMQHRPVGIVAGRGPESELPGRDSEPVTWNKEGSAMEEPTNRPGNPGLMLLVGAGAGAALSYFLDPDRGNRRRALVRDRVVSTLHDTGETLRKVQRDSRNRARGLAAKAETLVHRDHPTDRQLAERVRSKMGRFVSHPRAIDVTARQGTVELYGPILAEEKDDLLSAIRSVPGVHEVVDHLEAHEAEEGVPALQGGTRPPGAPFELAQANWSPAPRFLVGTLGSALLAYGLWARGRAGLSTALFGGGLLARSIANAPLRSAVGRLAHARGAYGR
jgi:hypothetical protein